MSRTEPLIALITQADEASGDAVLIRSPAVGILRGVPTPGHPFGPGEALAGLTILDRTHPLLIPEGVSGLVTEVKVRGRGADAIPVEFAQPIFTLAPIDAARDDAFLKGSVGSGAAAATGPASGEAIPEGCYGLPCPADGVFYRKPRPSEPPYVEVGSRVEEGQTLALIEAMKCFSAITYGAPGLPGEAEILEIRAEDASEVRHGQILFVVR